MGLGQVLGLRVSGGKDGYAGNAGIDVLGERGASKGIAEPKLELALHEFWHVNGITGDSSPVEGEPWEDEVRIR